MLKVARQPESFLVNHKRAEESIRRYSLNVPADRSTIGGTLLKQEFTLVRRAMVSAVMQVDPSRSLGISPSTSRMKLETIKTG